MACVIRQCPSGTTVSFEKMTNVNVRGVNLVPLYTGQGETPVSAECNNRCRAGPNCRAFVLNYEKHACMGMGYDSNSRSTSIIATSERTSLFEKICLSVPTCEKAWTFERVIGRQILGYDNRVLTAIASRLKCQEICLKERSFVCRSGEYDYLTQECRLSSEDRRTQPTHYTVAPPSVDYFENECSPLPLVKEDESGLPGIPNAPSECGYQRFENLELNRPDLMKSAFSEEQCKTLCEATRAFVCRSFAFKAASSLCWLNSDDSYSSGGKDSLVASPGVLYFERANCLNLKLDCTPEEMRISLNTFEPFVGKIYAKDDPLACESFGTRQRSTSLSLPLRTSAKCGVREENDGKYSTVVIIQYHPVIQRKGDRVVRLVCNFEAPTKLVTNSYRVIPALDVAGTAVVNATAPTPNIKLRITDKDGLDVVGARLGEELYLRIDMENDSVFDIFARELIARSGNAEEAITLIDSNGCPTDTAIFPNMERVPGSKSLQGKFDAFKFADDEIVRFQVNVHFCLQKCPQPTCYDASSSEDVVSPENNADQPPSYSTRARRRRETVDRYNNNESRKGINSKDDSAPLPDYPLHRELKVQGLASSNSKQNNGFSKKVPDSSSLFCTSKTTLMASLVASMIFQASLLALCCSCIFFYRFKGPSIDRTSADCDPCKNYSRDLWSSFSSIE
uniref:ZP domain-containing protein n=1 Tax=Tetranychus urticae TaxID=32264 RepID=T1KJV3_TETUR